MPKRRSQSCLAIDSRPSMFFLRQSRKTKSLPQPCILVNWISILAVWSGEIPRPTAFPLCEGGERKNLALLAADVRLRTAGSLQHRRDDFAPDQIIEAFPRSDHIILVAVHQNLRRLRMGIIVRCHGKAVGARAHHRQ